MEDTQPARFRFGAFTLDVKTGELCLADLAAKGGRGLVLQEQPLKVLLILVGREGEMATREEIKKKLWPNDTIVEFGHSINVVIGNLRRALGDSAEKPEYIETIARRGYRLMVPVEWIGAESAAAGSGEESSASEAGSDSDSEGPHKARLKVGRLTGRVVSHYRVLEVIGGGGMGLVYRAEDLKLGRAVALKFLPEEVGDDPKARERFNREAHAVSALDHPNICTVYDFDEHEGHPFIAMQLLQGKTLRDHIADGRFRLTQPEGLEIAIQIALGLEAAHEKGIIHRDIKPANIFITEKNVAKILDFGVAKVLQLSEVVEAPDFSPANGAASPLVERGNQSPPGLIPAQSPGNSPDGAPKGAPLPNTRTTGAPKGAPLQSPKPGLKPDEEEGGQRRAEARLFHQAAAAGPEFAADGAGAPAGAPAPAKETTLTRTGMKLGTAGYMSPEQVRGEPLDARTDIFSFGLVLYEMATGERAFTGETEAVVSDAIQYREPRPVRELVPDISLNLEEIIGNCLQKVPDHRYQVTADVRNDLQRAGSSAKTAEETRRRGRRWQIVTVSITLLVIVAGGFYYRERRSTGGLKEKDTVVIANFTNLTGDPVLGDALDTALPFDLQQSPFLQVLSPDKLQRALQATGRASDAALDPNAAQAVCRQTSSTAFVRGSISDLGNKYFIDMVAENCRNGEMLAHTVATANARDQVISALGGAGNELRYKLGEPGTTLEQFSKPLEQATSPSLEALQAYGQGKKANLRRGGTAAIPYYEQALQLDPNFAQVYGALGATYLNINQNSAATRNFTKAYELRDRVSDRERFYIEASYFSFVTGDLLKADEAYRQWIATYPGDFIAYANLPLNQVSLAEYEKALESARKLISLRPDSTPGYSQLLAGNISLDRLDEAKAIYERAILKFPNSEFLHEQRYEIAFLQRDGTAMQQQLRWAKATSLYPRLLLLWDEVLTSAYSGQLHLALRLASAAEQRATGAKNVGQTAFMRAGVAAFQAEFGNLEFARFHATQALQLTQGRDETIMAAVALARIGDAAEAQKLADTLNLQFPLNTIIQDYWLPTIRASIALGSDNPQQAIAVLESALPYELGNQGYGFLYPIYVRGIAYLKARQGEKAAAEFYKFRHNPGIVKNSPLASLAVLQLGRAQVMMGDKEAARKSYQDFLTLWKDADPDIPIYRQAKAEYKQLAKR